MSDRWIREGSHGLSVAGFGVGYDRVRRPDGESIRRAWLDTPGSVAVVAVRDDEVVLIEEYRPRLGETVLSCPIGGVERGESFVAAGVRELREETGFRADEARLLETTHPVSWLRRRRGIVLAPGVDPGVPDREADEFVRVHTLPPDEALAAVRDGPVTDWTLLPLLLAREEGHL